MFFINQKTAPVGQGSAAGDVVVEPDQEVLALSQRAKENLFDPRHFVCWINDFFHQKSSNCGGNWCPNEEPFGASSSLSGNPLGLAHLRRRSAGFGELHIVGECWQFRYSQEGSRNE